MLYTQQSVLISSKRVISWRIVKISVYQRLKYQNTACFNYFCKLESNRTEPEPTFQKFSRTEPNSNWLFENSAEPNRTRTDFWKYSRTEPNPNRKSSVRFGLCFKCLFYVASHVKKLPEKPAVYEFGYRLPSAVITAVNRRFWQIPRLTAGFTG